jgi:hypothetical protein
MPYRLQALAFPIVISIVAFLFASCAGTPAPEGEAQSASESEQTSGPLAELVERRPDPSLTAREVVATQLRALQHNDAADRGIEVAFRFASPQNREQTGPLSRFAQMLRSPVYSPMLQSSGFSIQGVNTSGNLASVTAKIQQPGGEPVEYVFILTRQRSGEYANSWMTAGVQRLNRTNQEDRFQSV